MKENAIKFSEWCYNNNYVYLPKTKEWRTFKIDGFLYFNSDELYEMYIKNICIQGTKKNPTKIN